MPCMIPVAINLDDGPNLFDKEVDNERGNDLLVAKGDA